ncbi:MAG TPA: hypothetical protein VHZ29_05485 [Rhizomicrobium sp.]|nr:hypothetical protein [Rhizomicrobium sp.]
MLCTDTLRHRTAFKVRQRRNCFSSQSVSGNRIFVPEKDDIVNPLGIKGVGELGNVGMNAAVANAVFHATGVRAREIPIRLEQLLAALD